MKGKTPEQYLKEHVILPEDAEEKGIYSSYELEFIRKYLDKQTLPESIDIEGKSFSGGEHKKEVDLKGSDNVQLVGFSVGNKEIAIPIQYVQEVIKMVEYTVLPSSPPLVIGVINLRNNIIPLIDVSAMLGNEELPIDNFRFIVVCNVKGFKIGILVEKITTMHKVEQKDLEWDIQSQIGVGGLVMGVIKRSDNLIGILDIDMVVNTILGH